MLKQQANNKEKVALYSRLSRDDGLDKESNSIANQREMLMRKKTSFMYMMSTLMMDSAEQLLTDLH